MLQHLSTMLQVSPPENKPEPKPELSSGIQVSCYNICVTLSNIPYLPFMKRAASALHHLQFVGVLKHQ